MNTSSWGLRESMKKDAYTGALPLDVTDSTKQGSSIDEGGGTSEAQFTR